jgi:hypothetical protein
MLVKTEDLTGNLLNYVAAKCENHVWRCPWLLEEEGVISWLDRGNPTPDYANDLQACAKIVVREGIWVRKIRDDLYVARLDSEEYYDIGSDGTTWTEAAIRCFVRGKLGEEVEISDQFK